MSEGQVRRARQHVWDAVERGAHIVCGFTPETVLEGRLFPPTVVDHVPFDARLACEETFAQIRPILRVRDEEEAIAIRNDSSFGLSGYVFSGDASKARALARRLDTGSECLNDVLVNDACSNAPLGGVKNSGLGFRNSPESLLQFCYSQTWVEDQPFLGIISSVVRREIAFPYRPRMVLLLHRLMKFLFP